MLILMPTQARRRYREAGWMDSRSAWVKACCSRFWSSSMDMRVAGAAGDEGKSGRVMDPRRSALKSLPTGTLPSPRRRSSEMISVRFLPSLTARSLISLRRSAGKSSEVFTPLEFWFSNFLSNGEQTVTTLLARGDPLFTMQSERIPLVSPPSPTRKPSPAQAAGRRRWRRGMGQGTCRPRMSLVPG
jgi:hypothetical protein